MNRRTFVTGLGALLAAPHAAVGQQPTKIWRIAWLSNAAPTGLDPESRIFEQAFRDIGYIEGQNIAVEFRWAEGPSDQLSRLAAEIVRRKVDAIVAVGPQAIRAATQATAAIPIVMMTSGDPVSAGFVANLAHPGGNVTGVSFLAEELNGKLLQLLKEAMPRTSRVAVLWNPANGAHSSYWKDVRAAAQTLRIELQSFEVRGSDEFPRRLEEVAREHADALLLLLDPIFTANARRIVEVATRNHLPTVYGLRQFTDAGGLLGYGASTAEALRLVASYVDISKHVGHVNGYSSVIDEMAA